MVAALLTALTLGVAPPTPIEFSLCAPPTGVPGQVAAAVTRLADDFEAPERRGVQFWDARPGGFAAGDFVEFRDVNGCVGAAARPNGAGVLAGDAVGGALFAAVRDPGGAWSAPTELVAERDDWSYASDSMLSAVSDRGDAVLAWADTRSTREGVDERLWLARRAPGGRFEKPFLLASTNAGEPHGLGVTATGEALVLWTENRGERAEATMLATAAPASAPLTAQLGVETWASRPALAIAPDGRAIVALPGRDGLAVAERPPGGTFGPPVTVAPMRDGVGARTAAALGPAGEAIVAWSGFSLGGTEVVTRRAPGAFDAPRTLAAAQARPPFDPWLASYGFELPRPDDGWDFGDADPQTALTGDGRALVSWSSHRGGLRYADVAAVPLDGSPVLAGAARMPTRYAFGVIPLLLPDGAPAVAWPDGSELWLAGQGAGGGPEPALPRVRVGQPTRRVLGPNHSLVLPVRCSSSCEVRGRIAASGVDETTSLTGGGTGKLTLSPHSLPIAPRRSGPVTVQLTYRALGGRRFGQRTLTVRLRRKPTKPDPRAVDLKATRVGNAVRVRWRTDRPTRTSVFYVTGAAERVLAGEPIAAENVVAKDGRRTFSVTLRPAAGIAWITLHTRTRDTLGLRVQRIAVP